MDTGAEALLDGADRPFDLANMTVCGNHVEMDWVEGIAEAREFVIGVDVGDGETATGVQFDDGKDLLQDCGIFAVGHGADSAELEVAGDRVEKNMTLDKKKSTQRTTLG